MTSRLDFFHVTSKYLLSMAHGFIYPLEMNSWIKALQKYTTNTLSRPLVGSSISMTNP
jgi:hypothetical protein